MRKNSKYFNVCFFALWVKKLLGSPVALDSQELGLSAIDEHKSYVRDENLRFLQNSHYIEVLECKDDALRVRIKQDFVGTCETGEAVEDDLARMFFATYMDPESGEQACSFK